MSRESGLSAWTRRLSGEIPLPKDSEAFALEDGACAVGIVKMHRDHGPSVGTDEERIAEMDVNFRHEERG